MSSVVYMLTIIPAIKMTSFFSSKYQMVLSALFLILLTWMLYSLDAISWPVYLMGAILGLSYTFYWTAFLINFAKDTDKEHRGEEVGIMHTLVIALSIIGPIAGALIITFMGYHVLFVLTAVVFLLSTYPLLRAPKFFEPGDFSLRRVFSKHYLKSIAGFFAMGGEYHSANMVIWPLFVFIMLSEYVLVGTIFSAGMLVSLIFTYILSEYADHLRKISLLRFGAVLSAATWFIKIFASSFLQIFSLHSLGKFFSTASGIPLEAIGFDRSQENVTEYVITRELAIHAATVLFFMIVILTNSLYVGLALGGIFALFYFLF
jgi:hypothetical protein